MMMVYKIYRTHVVARWNPVEHRHRHRVPAFLDVLIYQGGVPAAAGTVRNVSRDGLFINTDFDAVGVNQQVDLERSEEHTSELQSRGHLVCRLLLENKKKHERLPRRDVTSLHVRAG